MTPGSALTIVFSTTILITTISGVGGYCIGKFAPSYYRSISRNGNSADFVPEQIGLGSGIEQGFIGGLVLGFLLFVVLAIHDYKVRKLKNVP